MPQLEPETYVTQLFWLALTFIPLYLFLWKVVLPRIADILESRQNRIDHDLERASSLKSEAEEVRAVYEDERTRARAAALDEMRAASARAAEEAARANAAMADKLTRDIAAAEGRIAAERNRAIGNIEEISVGLAEAMSAKLAGGPVDARAVESAVEAAMREGPD
ncbi:MAG: F0F1 ATP synthase subunit B' [Alphaproteobacteria bacterium]